MAGNDELIRTINNFASGVAVTNGVLSRVEAEQESLERRVEALEQDRKEHCEILHKGRPGEQSLINRVTALETAQKNSDKQIDRKFVIASLVIAALGVIVAVIALLK